MGIASICTVSRSPSCRMIGRSTVTTREGDFGLSYSSLLKRRFLPKISLVMLIYWTTKVGGYDISPSYTPLRFKTDVQKHRTCWELRSSSFFRPASTSQSWTRQSNCLPIAATPQTHPFWGWKGPASPESAGRNCRQQTTPFASRQVCWRDVATRGWEGNSDSFSGVWKKKRKTSVLFKLILWR